MNRPEIDEFAALWQEGPDPLDQERIEELARVARRQGRFLAYADWAAGALLAATTVLGFVLRPAPATAVLAAALIGAMLWVNRKRRMLRQMSSTLASTSRAAFIDFAKRHAVSNQRRLVLSMCLVPAFVLTAVLFKLSYRSDGSLERPLEALAGWAGSTRGIIVISLTLVILGFLVRSWRRVGRELERLEALDVDYRDEAIRDEEESG